MFKSLVFVSFLAVALASPIDSGYVSTIEEMFNPENESAVCKEESEKFKQCFEVLKEEVQQYSQSSDTPRFPSREEINQSIIEIRQAVECVGEVTCNKLKLTVYIMENVAYAMEQIFGEGYSCLDEQNIKAGLLICFQAEARMEEVQAGGIEALASKMKPIAKCVSEGQDCEDKEKNAFYKGAMALADFAEVAMKVAHGVQTEQLGYIQTFDKKFNRADFDKLEL